MLSLSRTILLFFHKIPSILHVSVCLSFMLLSSTLSFSATVVEVDIAFLFIWGVGVKVVVQGWEYKPPTNVVWIQTRLSQHLIMLVEFIVGYLHCYDRFSSRYSGFPSKTNTSKLQYTLDSLEHTDTLKWVLKNSGVK